MIYLSKKEPKVTIYLSELEMVNLVKDYIKKELDLDIEVFIDLDEEYSFRGDIPGYYYIDLMEYNLSNDEINVLDNHDLSLGVQGISDITGKLFEAIFGEGVETSPRREYPGQLELPVTFLNKKAYEEFLERIKRDSQEVSFEEFFKTLVIENNLDSGLFILEDRKYLKLYDEELSLIKAAINLKFNYADFPDNINILQTSYKEEEKTYLVPARWEVEGTFRVEASSLEEALYRTIHEADLPNDERLVKNSIKPDVDGISVIN